MHLFQGLQKDGQLQEIKKQARQNPDFPMVVLISMFSGCLDYKVSLSQTIENIERGDYLFQFWYSSSGGQNQAGSPCKGAGRRPQKRGPSGSVFR